MGNVPTEKYSETHVHVVKNTVVYTQGTITLQRMSRELLNWAPLKLCSRATKANNISNFYDTKQCSEV